MDGWRVFIIKPITNAATRHILRLIPVTKMPIFWALGGIRISDI